MPDHEVITINSDGNESGDLSGDSSESDSDELPPFKMPSAKQGASPVAAAPPAVPEKPPVQAKRPVDRVAASLAVQTTEEAVKKARVWSEEEKAAQASAIARDKADMQRVKEAFDAESKAMALNRDKYRSSAASKTREALAAQEARRSHLRDTFGVFLQRNQRLVVDMYKRAARGPQNREMLSGAHREQVDEVYRSVMSFINEPARYDACTAIAVPLFEKFLQSGTDEKSSAHSAVDLCV